MGYRVASIYIQAAPGYLLAIGEEVIVADIKAYLSY
jgi:hypothetical protein